MKKHIDKEILKDLIEKGYSSYKMGEYFGVSPSTVRYHLNKYKLKTNYGFGSENGAKIKWTNKELAFAVKNSETKAQVLEKIGLSKHSHNYNIINKYIKKLNLDISHFNPGKYSYAKPYPDKDVFKKCSTYKTSKLYKRLVKMGREERCEMCGLETVWNNKPIRLQVHHINGINNDHRLENLRFLCPNCHSQTKTYCRGHK